MNGSIGKILSEATAALQSAQIPEPRMEAVTLLMHTLNRDRAYIVAHPESRLTEEEDRRFRDVVRRRASREPLQYITGVQEFFNLDFEVTPAVLIPRPETELIVEAATDLLKSTEAPLIADIGTGSGCLAISLLHEIKKAHVVGIDISWKALDVARRNGERHGVLGRFATVQADGLSALRRSAAFSAIVSNPPYIPANEIKDLQPEVRDHEPLSALVAGDDGLSHIRVVVREAAPRLQPGGYLIFEIGFDQSDAVRELISSDVWTLIQIRNDLQGIPRTVLLQRN